MYGREFNIVPNKIESMVGSSATVPKVCGECGISQPTTTTTSTGNVFGQLNGINLPRGQEEKSFWENKELVGEMSNMPRVFHFEGKTKREVEEIIGHVEQRPTDLSLHCLLNGHLQREQQRDGESRVELNGETRRFRGFTVLNGGEQKIRQIDEYEQEVRGEERPVWYVLSGMGIEEWKSGMCKEMMRFDAFRRSIMRSCELLRGYGIDLMEIVNGNTSGEVVVLSKLQSFVGLTSIQIALVDCLSLMGIKHDGLIGYSIGELVCAYADKCLTHEQTLLCSYFIGKCIQEFNASTTNPILRDGALMVQVCDLTWEQLKMKCPNGIVPVCFDSVDQYLITGPKQQVREFMRQLQLEGVYVREIEEKSEYCLMHSFYLTPCVEQLRKYLSTLNIKPTQRSSKWISTSIPENKWSESGSSSSVEYFLNMLCSPVMFHHALRHVPKNAIVVEISPRSFVQTLLKKALLPIHYQMIIRSTTQTQCTIIPLMPSFNTTTITSPIVEHFLTQLGRLYLEGVEFDSFKLYVPSLFVNENQFYNYYYPVPVTVELLNELNYKFNIKPHTSLYVVTRPTTKTTTSTFTGGLIGSEIKTTTVHTFKYTIDIESLLKKEDSYLLGHQINGRVLYPTSGYLYLVWKSLSQIYKPTTIGGIQNMQTQLFEEQEYWPSVEFENVQIHRATVLRDLIEQQYFYQQQQQQQQVLLNNNNEEKKVVFEVRIEPFNGKFELVEGENNLIVSGNYTLPTVQQQQQQQPRQETNEEYLSFRKHWECLLNGQWNLPIEKEEIYKQLRSMGYEYNGEFKTILRSNVQGTQAEIAWTGKWIPCLDALIQFNIFYQQQQQQQKQSQLLLPTRIRSIRIDPRQHMIKMDKSGVLPVIYEPLTNKIHCGAIEITGLELIPVVLPKGQFYPTIRQTINVQQQQREKRSTIYENVLLNGLDLIERLSNTTSEGRYLNQERPQQQQVEIEFNSVIVDRPSTTTTTYQSLSGERRSLIESFLNINLNSTGNSNVQFNGLLFNPQQTYVIVGALDCEFGMELAQWLVEFGGVRYLVLTTQRQQQQRPTTVLLNVQQTRRVNYLQAEFGCEIKLVSSCDLSDETECLSLIKSACKMSSTQFELGRIGGIFYLDTVFNQESVQGLYNMDKYTRMSRVMSNESGLFVVFTINNNNNNRSTQSRLNNDELYSIVERVCEYRRREYGKHALCVEWNGLFDVEYFGWNKNEIPSTQQFKTALIKLENLIIKSRLFNQYNNTILPTQSTLNNYLMPQRVIEKLNDCEIQDVNGNVVVPLFVIHPIEGNVNMLKHWAKHIKYPVYGIQFTEEALFNQCDTVEKLAEFYWQQIEKQFPQLTRVHLCGHSFGLPVAFEMSLRRTDRIVSLTLLDSGLTETFLNNERNISGQSSSVELEGLFRFYQQYVQPTIRMRYEQFVTVLSQYQTFDERVRYVVREVMDKSMVQYDLFDLDMAVRSFVCKYVMCYRYIPTLPLRLSEIMYFRPTQLSTCIDFFYQTQEIVENVLNGLKNVFSGKLQVQVIDAEPKCFLEGENACKIASALNEYLIKFF